MSEREMPLAPVPMDPGANVIMSSEHLFLVAELLPRVGLKLVEVGEHEPGGPREYLVVRKSASPYSMCCHGTGIAGYAAVACAAPQCPVRNPEPERGS